MNQHLVASLHQASPRHVVTHFFEDTCPSNESDVECIYSDSSHGHQENTSFAPLCCWLRRWRECLGCPDLDSCCNKNSRKVSNWNEKVAACRSMRTCISSPFLGGEQNNTPNFDKMPTEPSRILAHTQTLRRVGKVCGPACLLGDNTSPKYHAWYGWWQESSKTNLKSQ